MNTQKESLNLCIHTFSSREEDSEVHVFTQYKFEETVATRSRQNIKTGELTAVARRYPELDKIITV